MMAKSSAIPMAGLSLATFGIYIGAMGKSAQFPFHIWLARRDGGPDARSRAHSLRQRW
jgi:NADH:ubiquinone oxidoreductase subunit 5 (subunit L)/multisubunit Na+/H+ antiporter MnhA subunit